MPDLDQLERLWRAAARAVPVGEASPWKIVRSFVTEDQARENLRHAHLFGEERYTPAGYYTALVRAARQPHLQDEVWMADSPDEREDHRECFEQCKLRGGRVLIHGLGLGLITYAVLSLANVEHVDVVEIDEDVIRLVRAGWLGRYRGQRLTVHHDDCFTKTWPADAAWSVVWHDIWLPMSAANLAQIDRLHRMFAHRCQWQGSWGREWILDERRRRVTAGGPTGVPAGAHAAYVPEQT
jgi:hypothetical protein